MELNQIFKSTVYQYSAQLLTLWTIRNQTSVFKYILHIP